MTRVILFDANKAELGGKERTTVFGRLVIALMNYAAQQRMVQDEKKLKPCFFFMDEAHDYVSNDASFVEMMEQARSKRIGLTVAHHFEGQMDNLKVKQALQMAAIQVQCLERGHALFNIKSKQTLVTYPKFKHPGRINNEEFLTRYFPRQLHELKTEHHWEDATDV